MTQMTHPHCMHCALIEQERTQKEILTIFAAGVRCSGRLPRTQLHPSAIET